MKSFLKNKNGDRGFLLVELIVALFIFSIVMVVAIGSIVSALDANRKAQSLESVMNNLSLAMDEMTKSLAVGKNYNCDGSGAVGDGVGDDCAPSGAGPWKALTFTSQDNQVVTYTFTTDAGVCPNGCITRKIGSGPALRLTATEINIKNDNNFANFDKSGFFVEGTNRFSNSDMKQPIVHLIIFGTAQAGPRNNTSFTLQTSVSQRTPDINS